MPPQRIVRAVKPPRRRHNFAYLINQVGTGADATSG
jgi:hypothetical protein